MHGEKQWIEPLKFGEGGRSRGISVYLLPEAFIHHLPGCNDEQLLAKVLEEMSESLDGFDEQAQDSFGDAGLPLTMKEAIRGLFSGRFDADYPFYGIAFEFVCVSVGAELDNRGFVPCSVGCEPLHARRAAEDDGLDPKAADRIAGLGRCLVRALVGRRDSRGRASARGGTHQRDQLSAA